VRAAGTRFARDDKEPAPSWGRNKYPESGLVNPPRRDTRAFSPAGMFGGKAPPRCNEAPMEPRWSSDGAPMEPRWSPDGAPMGLRYI